MIRTSSESRLLVVCYHYIRDPGQYKYPGIHPAGVDEFSRHVKHLYNHYHMATPEEVENFVLKGYELSQPSVLLSFDDGLVDHAIAAEEVLDPFNIKGAFFITTKPLIENRMLMVHKVHWLRATTPPDKFRNEFEKILSEKYSEAEIDIELPEDPKKTYPFDTEEDARLKYFINYLLPADMVDDICSEMLISRDISEEELCSKTYMSEKSIRELSSKGHIIGSHGHTHTPLSKLNSWKLTEEIETNISFLEKIIKEKVTWISYPYGMKWSVPQNFDKNWKEFGFHVGFSLDKEESGWNNGTESPFWLKRINCNLLELFTKNFSK